MPPFAENKEVLIRINRLEGRVKATRKMIQTDRGFSDILVQIAATMGAARALGQVILEEHLKSCAPEAIRRRRDDIHLVDQVLEVFKEFSKAVEINKATK